MDYFYGVIPATLMFAATALGSHVAVQLVTVRLVELFRPPLWSPCCSSSLTSSAATIVISSTTAKTAA